MRRALRISSAGAGLLVAAFLIYEGFALFRAKQRAPAVLAAAAKGELALDALTDRRRAMLLKVEDPGFYDHRGVDFATPG